MIPHRAICLCQAEPAVTPEPGVVQFALAPAGTNALSYPRQHYRSQVVSPDGGSVEN